MSTRTSIFPDLWKNANVITLFKSGEKTDPSNYRPISISPTINKLLEKAIHKQLYDHLHHNNLLTVKQFGFRTKYSTSTALLDFTDTILQNLDDGFLSGVIFLDLQKACDTVDHCILLGTMLEMGVSQRSCEWFKSYLDNRQQRTVFTSFTSDSAHVAVDVPQGSVLGPLMFLIYINDIQDCLQFTNVTLYADDTALYCSSEAANDLHDKLNHYLASVTNWMRSNKLTLNTSKSKFMLVGSRRRLGAIQSIEI